MSDPPNRKDSSLELTAVRPRPVLAEDDDIMLTEMLAAAERVRRDAQDEIGTLVSCEWCSGCGMVTPEKAADWRAKYPELAATTEPPPSRPEAA